MHEILRTDFNGLYRNGQYLGHERLLNMDLQLLRVNALSVIGLFAALPLFALCDRIWPVKTSSIPLRFVILVFGDALTLALTTIFGFAFHDELGTFSTRMLATFIPLLVGWLLIAPHLGAYDLRRMSELGQLWRPFWAMVLAAPLAAWLRGVWLNSVILPIFVVVLGGISALALLLWRLIYFAIGARLGSSYG
jgi:hypothetical protein